MNGVCAPNGVGRCFRETDVTCLSFGHESAHFTDRIFDGNRLVDSMGKIDVDPFDAKTLQRSLAGRTDIVRAAVDAPAAVRQKLLAEFLCDYDLVADRGKRFANEFLVAKGTIGVSRIEKIDAEFDG